MGCDCHMHVEAKAITLSGTDRDRLAVVFRGRRDALRGKGE